MSVYSLARKHSKIFLGREETAITFINPTGLMTATVIGRAITHHTSLDDDGIPVNSLHAHVTISESTLTDEGYTVRSGGKVNLVNHRVSFADSAGVIKTYVVKSVMPDNTIGIIPLILGRLTNG